MAHHGDHLGAGDAGDRLLAGSENVGHQHVIGG
jgi:hypothetical protein